VIVAVQYGVRILTPSGWQDSSTDAFFALPLSTRIQHVLQRTVEFRRGRTGEVVSAQDVIAEFRKAKAA
jgi:hypothetical protein